MPGDCRQESSDPESGLHKSPMAGGDIPSRSRPRVSGKAIAKEALAGTKASRNTSRACTNLQYAKALAMSTLRSTCSSRVKRRGGPSGPAAAAFTNAMLQSLAPGGVMLEGARFLPQILSPLIAAAERAEPLEPVVSAIVRMFGFDTFLYGASLSARPGQEALSYVFTTSPRDWVVRYDQRAYIEVDPRVLYSFESAMPYIWDQASERGKSAAIDALPGRRRRQWGRQWRGLRHLRDPTGSSADRVQLRPNRAYRPASP